MSLTMRLIYKFFFRKHFPPILAKLSRQMMGAMLVLYTWRESRSESLKGILCRNCYVLTDIIATFPLSVDNAERHR